MNPDSTTTLLSDGNALGQLPGSLAAPALGAVLLKLGLGLIAVIVLILVLQRIAKRFRGGLPRRGDPIRLLAQKPLGPRLSLAVVEVMDRTFLVGVSPHGVERVADLTAARARQRAPRATFEEAARMSSSPATSMEGLGWKERFVRSFAQVLAGGAKVSVASGSASGEAGSVPERPARKHPKRRVAVEPPACAHSESGFEEEFRRRLQEIQARYPQISELEAKAAVRGTT